MRNGSACRQVKCIAEAPSCAAIWLVAVPIKPATAGSQDAAARVGELCVGVCYGRFSRALRSLAAELAQWYQHYVHAEACEARRVVTGGHHLSFRRTVKRRLGGSFSTILLTCMVQQCTLHGSMFTIDGGHANEVVRPGEVGPAPVELQQQPA